MTSEEAVERAADLLAAVAEPTRRMAEGEVPAESAVMLLDGMIEALTPDEASEVLFAMTGIASTLLLAVSLHTGNRAEDILMAVRLART